MNISGLERTLEVAGALPALAPMQFQDLFEVVHTPNQPTK